MRGGKVGIAPVPLDRLPEPLPPGLNFGLVITIQTDGPRNFDRPVPVRFPNTPDPVTGKRKLPGEKSALWSFDHDTGEWDVVGQMTVTADGLFVDTDPGVGVLQPGWHGQDPASKTDGTLSVNPKFKQTGDVVWNGLQAGVGLTEVAFDVVSIFASASPIGSFYAGFGFVLDVGDFILMPSWGNAGKAALGGLSIIPGVGGVIKAGALLSDLNSTVDAAGKLAQATMNTDASCNPGAPSGFSNRPKPAGSPGVVRVPPPTYFARRYYRGPEQTLAVARVREAAARFDAELAQQRPHFRKLDKAIDVLLPEFRRIVANPDDPFPQPELDALVPPARDLYEAFFFLRERSHLGDLARELIRAYAEFLQLFDFNSALVSIEKASGEGEPVKVLLNGYQQAYGLKKPAYYRLVGHGTVQRGRTKNGSNFKLILRPDTIYRLDVLDSVTLAIASRPFVSGPTGGRSEINPLLLGEVDRSADADGDGLRDFAEGIIGTSAAKADSDGDGVADVAEVQGGTNPLDNIPTEIGIIGALALPASAAGANAVDVCAAGNRAFIALEGAGVAILDVSRPSQPVILAQVDTPGTARRVACDSGFVAVADGGAGLTIIDISDPPAAAVASYLPEVGNALSVTTADGVAYVGTQAGEIVRVHLATRTELGRVNVGAAVHDLAFEGTVLFLLTPAGLSSYRLVVGELEPLGNLAHPGLAEGLSGVRRLAVGGGIAYATSFPGYATIDIRNPSAMTLIAPAVDGGPNSFKQIAPNGSGLGVAAVGVVPRDDGTHDVELYDVRSPAVTTAFLARITTPGIARSLALHRGLAYVADGKQGLQVVNYLAFDQGTKPPSATLIASFPLDPAEAEQGSFAALGVLASDDVQVREVEFYVDGEPVALDGSFPFEFRFRIPLLTATKTAFTLRARAVDTGGNATFTPEVVVRIAPDQTPPRARPAGETANGFSANTQQVLALFNEPIEEATLTAASFSLRAAGADRAFGTADDRVIPAAIRYLPDSRTAVLDLDTVLPAGRYQARLTRGVTDLAGNALAAEVFWNFDTVIGLDTDGDGLTDEFELAGGMNPQKADENNNGIPDVTEDFDGDGLVNGVEMLIGTHPKNPRTFDGVLDSQLDRDGDRLTDVLELRYGTDRFNADTDGDGWNDEAEVTAGSDPLVPNLALAGLYAGQPVVTLLRAPFTTADVVTSTLLRPDGQATQLASPAVELLRLGLPGPGEPATGGGAGIYVAHPAVNFLRHATGPNGEATSYVARPAVEIRREE